MFYKQLTGITKLKIKDLASSNLPEMVKGYIQKTFEETDLGVRWSFNWRNLSRSHILHRHCGQAMWRVDTGWDPYAPILRSHICAVCGHIEARKVASAAL